MSEQDDAFRYTTLDGQPASGKLDRSFKFSNIDILNHDEDQKEEVLREIFNAGSHSGLYPAIGLIPYEAKASIVNKTRNLIEFNRASYHGMSGSPIRFQMPLPLNHNWYASSILSKGSNSLAVGCRFTQEKIEAIGRWKKTISGLTSESISSSMGNDKSVIYGIIEEDKGLASRVMEGASGVISGASSFIGQGLSSASSALSAVESFFKK